MSSPPAHLEDVVPVLVETVLVERLLEAKGQARQTSTDRGVHPAATARQKIVGRSLGRTEDPKTKNV